MKLDNKIMLITYADSMGKNISELHEILDRHYKKAVGGVHILPFFPPPPTAALRLCGMTLWTKNSAHSRT